MILFYLSCLVLFLVSVFLTSKPFAQQIQRCDLTERHFTRQMAPSGMGTAFCPFVLIGLRSSSRQAAILQSSIADEIRAHFSFDRTSAKIRSFIIFQIY